MKEKSGMKGKIHKYIYENLLDKEVEIEDATPLYSSALITSMGHLKLINHLEHLFDISMPMSQINLDNFDSINQMVQFIQELKSNQPAG